MKSPDLQGHHPGTANPEVGMSCQAGVEEGLMLWEMCFFFWGGGGTMEVELNDPIVA